MTLCPQCNHPNENARGFCSGCSLYLGPLGRYRLLRAVKEGGFGTVYRGMNVCTGYPVAIKVMHKRLAQREVFRRRFVREARILEQIQHPHVVRIFEHGIHEKLGLYLVMEWLDGTDLSHMLSSEREPLSRLRLVSLFGQLLDGLRGIHANQVVHRDLKPPNLRVVREHGREILKILDFGIAWSETGEHLTKTGMSMGTPRFMAPEQIDGNHEDIGPHTDLYAAGMILAWMLTGRYLVEGESSQEICFQQCYVEPPTLTQICPERTFSPELEALVAKAVCKKYEQRFQNADEFLHALHKALPLQSSELLSLWGEHPSSSTSADFVFDAIQSADSVMTLDEDTPFPMMQETTPSHIETKVPESTPLQTPNLARVVLVEEERQAVDSRENWREITSSGEGEEGCLGEVSSSTSASFSWSQTPVQVERPVVVTSPGRGMANRIAKAKAGQRWSWLLGVVLVLGLFGGVWVLRNSYRPLDPGQDIGHLGVAKAPEQREEPNQPTVLKKTIPAKRKGLSAQRLVARRFARRSSRRLVVLGAQPPRKGPTGHPAGGILSKRSVMERKRKRAGSQFLLASLSEADGRYDDAIEFYRKVLELQPQYAIAHFRLGRLLMKSSQCFEQRMPLDIPHCRIAVKHYRIYLQHHLPAESQYTTVAKRYIRRLTQVQLRLSTVPRGASVYQGEQLLGRTPLRLWRGWKRNQTLRVVLPGFQPCRLVWEALENSHLWVPLLNTKKPKKQDVPCRFLYR